MKKHLVSLFIFLCLMLSIRSIAEAEGRYYLSARAGGNLVDEAENTSSEGSFNISFDPGYGVLVAAGYDLGESRPKIGIGRVELEVGYRSNGIEKVNFLEGKVEGEGDLNVLSVMVNSFGESRKNLPWIPYVGVGLGYAHVILDKAKIAGRDLADGSDNVFAYQAGLGMGIEINPHLTIDLGYRYFATLDPTFTDANGDDFDSEVSSHLFLAGLRASF